jgi:alpha-tubulin suppressor-like RCC1 family protein
MADAAEPPVTFGPRLSHPIPERASASGTGDFNEDGHLDAVLGSSDGIVHVLFGTGGAFGTRIDLLTGMDSEIVPIQVGDINADSNLDILVLEPHGCGCGFRFLGAGDGTFGPAGFFGGATIPLDFKLADVDNDTDLDVVETAYFTERVVVLLNDGNGTFGPETHFTFPTSGRTVRVEVGDLDADGNVDLVVVQTSSSSDPGVHVLLGNGDGTFAAPVPVAGTESGLVAIADLDGDTTLDLAVTDLDDSVRTLMGNGDGTFGAPTSYDAPTNQVDVQADDMNGDGSVDLVVTSFGGTASVLLGEGDGTFAPRTDFASGSEAGTEDMEVADFNADGRPDLFLPVHGDAGIRFNSTGLFPPEPPIGVAATAGVGKATVSWVPPDPDGGPPIQGYEVTPYVGAVAQTTVVFDSPATTQTVTGLTNGTTYTFRVASVSFVGTGSQSSPSNAVTPVTPPALAAGGAHSCALLPASVVQCWGSNASGQLGDGTTVSHPTAALVPGLDNVRGVAAGQSHTCAVKWDSTVWCWGSNAYGQLGDGTTSPRLVPTKVPGLTGATAVASFRDHTCAIVNGGAVRCWGYNGHGELGDGTTIHRTVPVPVVGLSGAARITTGSWHTCARLTNGTARCWGSNTRGQLGDGTLTERHTPVTVSGLSGAGAIDALGSSTCAVVAGTARCWGLNHHGQLGDGTIANRKTPVTVTGLSGVADLAGGLYHACARLSSGTVRCWGGGSRGQLGNGSVTATQSTPVTVSGLTSVSLLAAGSHHNVARRTTAHRAWGANGSAQLGDGTSVDRAAPVPITVG